MSKAKTKKPNRSFGKTTAKNLEAKFDAGEDVSDYFDSSKARRINRDKQPSQTAGDEKQIVFRKTKPKNWKAIVFANGFWPRTLMVPQHAKIPPGSKSLLCLCTENEEWDYQLLRGSKGRGYYLRVWPWDYKGEMFDENFTAPAARLTPAEAFRFAVANLVPREILEDCPDQTAAILKQ